MTADLFPDLHTLRTGVYDTLKRVGFLLKVCLHQVRLHSTPAFFFRAKI